MSMNCQERENITVGQKVYLFYSGYHWNQGRYSMPLSVTHVTKTQFTVAAADMDSKPKRFMKSNGNEVGKGYSRNSTHVSLVTKETTAEVKAFNAERRDEADKAASEARQTEVGLRKKYGAMKITDDAIQEKFLAPLRALAESGEHEMSELLRSFDGVSIDAENFYRVEDAIDRENRNGSFATGKVARDKSRDLHSGLVDLAIKFNRGSRYEIGGKECNDLSEILMASVKYALNRELDNVFGYTFHNYKDVSKGLQQYISALRQIVGAEYRAPRVSRVKED